MDVDELPPERTILRFEGQPADRATIAIVFDAPPPSLGIAFIGVNGHLMHGSFGVNTVRRYLIRIDGRHRDNRAQPLLIGTDRAFMAPGATLVFGKRSQNEGGC